MPSPSSTSDSPNISAYDYYVQNGPDGRSIRRYRKGSDQGERWGRAKEEWTDQCAPREACITTKDQRVSEKEALALVMGGMA